MASSFVFSHETRTKKDAFLQRFFSILPGFLSWSILISMITLSFLKPLVAAMLVVAIHLYWLFRMLYMTLFLSIAYMVLAVEKETDWIRRCHLLEEGKKGLEKFRLELPALRDKASLRRRINLRNQERELQHVVEYNIPVPSFDAIYHVVIIAAAKESRQVIEPGIQGMLVSQFPSERMVPVIAIEGRSGHEQERMAQALCETYRKNFFDFLVTMHPENIPGEAPVKGANVSYAARQAASLFEKKGIPFENVIVSCFDADTIPSARYFAALTYHFMRHPRRTRASFQPIPVYHNNILEAPAFVRILETGSSFFQLIEATNPEKLVTFSSHSMSFKALVEIGYWPVDMISDDSAIFWKAFIHYGGDYRVVPMYVTLSMDAVVMENFWKTVKAVYLQKRRWAWGVENFPIVMRAFLQEKGISVINKIRYMIKLLEMHVSWATLGFLVTIIGWLPAVFASQEFSNSVMFYNSSRISALIFNLASFTFVVTIYLSQRLLPRHKAHIPFFKRVLYALEWFLIPFVFTFLSSLPSLDAQTRLACGKMLHFFVTEKKR